MASRVHYNLTNVETGEVLVDGTPADLNVVCERLGITVGDMYDALDDGQVTGSVTIKGDVVETWPKAV
ncbi:hypothetical protein [Bradyrhizobium sp. WSM1253]|uniref:hypothetical protein n=1 Tax=Bradyrhizobium sp. WSM1253 TaxID=319003 RepID=UPI00025D2E3F|nr:hypothetical protein [Bradyrhizobium sp. WSM1253]EIG62920.1 hypothetical protein Bra1253DRAFT_07865 [Bradyrhizobium sp. WSM1253]